MVQGLAEWLHIGYREIGVASFVGTTPDPIEYGLKHLSWTQSSDNVGTINAHKAQGTFPFQPLKGRGRIAVYADEQASCVSGFTVYFIDKCSKLRTRNGRTRPFGFCKVGLASV
jgi:hypothetical protein